MNLHDLDTPVAVVDLDRVEANIARFQRYLDERHIAHRPHIKTFLMVQSRPTEIQGVHGCPTNK